MPTFLVISEGKALKVLPPNIVSFIDDKRLANSYPSRYAAKMHLRNLEGVPNNVQIVETVMEKI